MPGRETDRSKLDTERRRFLKGTGAGALAVGLAGCTGGDGEDGEDTPTDEDTPTPTAEPDTAPPEENIPEGGTFTVGVDSPPEGMNPLSTNSAYSWVLLDHFYAYGTTIDPVTNEVRPQVFTDWTVEDVDSGEPNIYTNVRDGLTWNDGEDFGMDDVLFTYQYINENEPGPWLNSVEPITEVSEADNDFDFHISLNDTIGTWDSTVLQIPFLPKHIWEGIDDFTTYTPGEEGEVIGLFWGGELAQFEPDTSAEITFRKTPLADMDWIDEHPNLNAGGPFLDSVRFRFYQSDSVMNQDLFAGELDSHYGSIDTSNIEKAQDDDRIDLIQGKDSGFGYIGFNLRRTPLDDITFRQALSFVWDEVYWIDRLLRGQAFDGDFIMPPGYESVRPETAVEDAEILTDPATEAFKFREASAGVPDYEGIRNFLTNGEAITGEGGEYVGREYPGTLTDVSASHDGGMHDYSFGEVKSDVLKEEGVNQELYVNGQTIPELKGGPLSYLMYPPELVPELTQMDEIYTQNLIQLGIPVEREVQTFNSLLGRIYQQEDFDIYHMGWTNLSSFGVSSLYSIFHSDQADDHRSEDGNVDLDYNNAYGYGVFDYATADEEISAARTEMDTEERNSLVRRATEKVYLDMPIFVFDYDKIQWPVNGRDFNGFLEGITSPGGSANLVSHFYNLHQAEE